MSETLDKIGPAPETHSVRFMLLLFGACAAPIFWLGQVMLGYAVTAYGCYPGDHPGPVVSSPALGAAMIVFDIVALSAAAAGGAISLWSLRRARHKPQTESSRISEGRVRFLAVWGIFSSLWFFCAIIFNIMGSLTVPPCLT